MPLINPAIGVELLQFQGAMPAWFSAFNESIFDDFTGAQVFTNRWTSATSGAGSAIVITTGVAEHPGLCEIRAGTAAAGAAQIIGAFPASALILPPGRWEFRVMANLAQLSTVVDRFICRMGLSDAAVTGDVTDGVYFEYSDNINGGNWTLCTAAAAVRTKIDSGVPAVAGSYNEFSARGNVGSSEISYYIDDVLVGSVTATIPIAATNMIPGQMLKSAGAITRSLFLDYWWYAYSFTTGR
jgi:hypothetical protein